MRYSIVHSLSFSLLFSAVLSGCSSHSYISGVGFDTDTFDQIKPGMARAEVDKLLGSPYHSYNYETGETWVWVYATDRRAESLAIVFVEDKVAEVSAYNESLDQKNEKGAQHKSHIHKHL